MTTTGTIGAEYQSYCTSHDAPERIEVMLCDLNAVLRGKWLRGDEIDKLAKGQVRLPQSTYAPSILGAEVPETGLGAVQGDPDGMLTAIPGTLLEVPWAEGNVAQVLAEMLQPDGTISPLSPRQCLARQVSALADEGLFPVVASELEFYILRPRSEEGTAPEPPEGLPETQNYELGVLERYETLLSDILSAAALQGLPTDTLIAEYGPGQFEVNFRHGSDILAAADTAVLFRRLVCGVAAQHGLEATFMAKPYAEHPGNGMHVHLSLLDGQGSNVFSAESGLAPMLQQAVAGVLDSMAELQLLFAPHFNSYRRFQPGGFSPATADWGLDHRGAALRLPQTDGPAARLEHRISGADANPYLVIAAILAGVRRGLRGDLELPPPLDSDGANAGPPLSHDWLTALQNFETSQIALDLLGPEYHPVYCAVKRDEIARITSIISPAEYSFYLSRL